MRLEPGQRRETNRLSLSLFINQQLADAQPVDIERRITRFRDALLSARLTDESVSATASTSVFIFVVHRPDAAHSSARRFVARSLPVDCPISSMVRYGA